MIARSFSIKKSSSSSSSRGIGNSENRAGQNLQSISERIVDGLFRSNRVQNNEVNDVDENESDVIGELVVVVTDQGIGISKENQKLLFQEGRQFDAENLQTGGGSGFGE